ncbi:alpha/beta fold hydrolase [Peribacillus tepidiphilus]|uniref:alpha/beta fold hydrolase n=1 Tax=Peribacillus tepidiphilus TaxID=2652445 RepID=UPI0035B53B58
MYCSLKNASIHYVTYGEGKPILILHPLATDHRSMKAWLEPVFMQGKGFKRIYVDIPAHGKSKREDWVKTTDDMLDLLLQFIDKILPNEEFSLLGMSFGGYLAQGILNKRAAQIKGIALLCPPTRTLERTLPKRVILKRDDDLFDGLDEGIAQAFDLLLATQTKETLNMFLEEFQPGRLLADREFLASDWRTKRYHFSFEPFPEGSVYEQPTLILTGRQDYICGFEDPFRLLNHFPNATYSVINGTGHLLHIEQREQVQFFIGEWLKEL